jgi:hypothetical protein
VNLKINFLKTRTICWLRGLAAIGEHSCSLMMPSLLQTSCLSWFYVCHNNKLTFRTRTSMIPIRQNTTSTR